MAGRLHEHGSRNKVSMIFERGSRGNRKYIPETDAKKICTVCFNSNVLAILAEVRVRVSKHGVQWARHSMSTRSSPEILLYFRTFQYAARELKSSKMGCFSGVLRWGGRKTNESSRVELSERRSTAAIMEMMKASPNEI
jgi:hypothetical protein